MASSRKTYDTDSITLRTVFAKNVDNTNIPALRTLTADGAGRCYWAIPSTLGVLPAFNEIVTSAGSYTADLSYNTFRLNAATGIGMFDGASGSNQTNIYAKCFTNIDVSGGNSIYAFSNNYLTPYVRLAGQGSIQVIGDPATNTLIINGPTQPPYAVSTGIYGFNTLKVTPAASTITADVYKWNGDILTADSASTILRFSGVNDIKLSTNVTNDAVFFTISTFTSKGYLDISAAAFSAFGNTTSSISSLYLPISTYSTVVGLNFSTTNGTIWEQSTITGEEFWILTGLINARATIIQLNSEIANVNSTITGLGTLGYVSSPKYNFVSSIPFMTTDITTNAIVNASGNMTFSTFQFSLSSFSTYITNDTRVLIEQKPNITFSGVSSINNSFGNQSFTQDIALYTNNFTTLFSETRLNPYVPFSVTSNQSNFYGPSLLYQLNTSNLLSNITSTFQTRTTISNAYFFSNVGTSNTPGFIQSTVRLHYPSSSLFLHIYNS